MLRRGRAMAREPAVISHLPSGGVLAAVLPGVSRSAGLVCPPAELPGDALGGAALNGEPLTGPAASARPLPARSTGATPGVLTVGTGAGVHTCCAAAGEARKSRAKAARMKILRSEGNVGGHR